MFVFAVKTMFYKILFYFGLKLVFFLFLDGFDVLLLKINFKK
jgi:hypothetical protein